MSNLHQIAVSKVNCSQEGTLSPPPLNSASFNIVCKPQIGALCARASEELIVAALCHDIGTAIFVENHSANIKFDTFSQD